MPARRNSKPGSLTHLDSRGRASMVDVGAKPQTAREALAEATVRMRPETLKLIVSGRAKKGDVFAVARVAGIQAAKRTSELIPLCHQIPLHSVGIEFFPQKAGALRIEARARCSGQTGVEMEALTAAAVAALTVYDMLKAAERGIEIGGIRLLEKRGGKTGPWKRGAR